jgi:hypothetical protein
MQETRKLTTDEVREAYRGLLVQTGEHTYEFIDQETADREFDLWLYTERNRVAALATNREQKRIVKLIKDASAYERLNRNGEDTSTLDAVFNLIKGENIILQSPPLYPEHVGEIDE